MNLGAHRTRMNVEELTETRTADGEIIENWIVDRPVWAQVMGLRGRELFSAQQVNALTSHKVTIRYFRGLKSKKHRLTSLDSKRVLNIQSVVDIGEKHDQMELVCQEVTDG